MKDPGAPLAKTAAVFGGAVLILGMVLDFDRARLALLVGSLFLLGLGAGALLFLAVGKAAGATWFLPFRRVPQALSALILPSGFLVLLALGLRIFFEPHHASHTPSPAWFREWWLEPGFLITRAFLILGLWVLFRRILVNQSLNAGRAASAVFLIVFALTVSLSAFDWVMPLWHHWSSTMFGVYQFSGMFSSALAALALLFIALRRESHQENFKDAHLHDLGKLLFGFSCFWMYIWFCQYMLIWYTDIPEETTLYVAQTQGGWAPLFYLNLALNCGFPFFALLPRPAKMSDSVMMKASVSILLGRFLDLYLCTYPSQGYASPPLGPWELAAGLGSLGLVHLVFRSALEKDSAEVPGA